MSKNTDRILWSVLLVNMYIARIKADKIVLGDLNFSVWVGAGKYVDR